jgi:hypothetical protein
LRPGAAVVHSVRLPPRRGARNAGPGRAHVYAVAQTKTLGPAGRDASRRRGSLNALRR